MTSVTTEQAETKKGGPYSAPQRDARRAEVYRLHFELGYPITRIADLMKVNPNTISTDVSVLYSKLKSELHNLDLSSWLLKQIHRLEIQRTRMLEELKKADPLSDKLAIEKILLDIDSKILQTATKIYSTTDKGYEMAIKKVNKYYESQKMDDGFVVHNAITNTSAKAQEKIWKIIEEDERIRRGSRKERLVITG